MSSFDPYYTWLGIPPADQPPNHYRLLGLQVGEENANAIEHAADRVMIHLRTFASGKHGVESQRLLNEVATARLCLLDPPRKAKYDAELRAKEEAAIPRAIALDDVPMAVLPIPAAQPATPVLVQEAAPAFQVAVSAPAKGRRPAGKRRAAGDGANPEAAAAVSFVKIIMGGLGGLSMAVLIVWIFFRADPLGLFAPEPKRPIAKLPQPPVKPEPPKPEPKPAPNGGKAKSPGEASPVGPVEQGTTKKGKRKTKATAEGESPTANPEGPTPLSPMPVPMPQPVDPMPTAPEPTTPETFPVTPPADTRHPQPTQSERDAKLVELKGVYKSEFDAGGRAASRDKYIDFLLATADTLKSDQIARYVLLREAFDRLIAVKDFSRVVDVVDRLEQEYVTDPLALRTYTLTEASDVARQPADKQAVVLCALDLAEAAIARQRLKEALSLARMADGQSRTLADVLRARALALKGEIERHQAEFDSVEKARKTLATMPNDGAALLVDGKYRCLVLGEWAEGLPILARGGDAPLAAAARLDIAGVSPTVSAGQIGDAWFALGDGNDKQSGCLARALYWYRQAVDAAPAIEQDQMRRKIEAIEAKQLPARLLADSPPSADEPLPSFASMYFRDLSFEPVDLFKYVALPELLDSPWDRSQGASSPAIHTEPGVLYGRVPSHFPNAPREYQVAVKAHHYYSSQGKEGPLVIGLVGPKSQFAVMLDWPISSTEYASFVTTSEAKTLDQNPSLTRSPSKQLNFSDDPVICQVRRNGVTVRNRRGIICEYQGDMNKLMLPREWAVADNKAFFLGAHLSSYRVNSWVLEPLSAAP
jgi:tetratricopeptide (TPR) repeat protein